MIHQKRGSIQSPKWRVSISLFKTYIFYCWLDFCLFHLRHKVYNLLNDHKRKNKLKRARLFFFQTTSLPSHQAIINLFNKVFHTVHRTTLTVQTFRDSSFALLQRTGSNVSIALLMMIDLVRGRTTRSDRGKLVTRHNTHFWTLQGTVATGMDSGGGPSRVEKVTPKTGGDKFACEYGRE